MSECIPRAAYCTNSPVLSALEVLAEPPDGAHGADAHDGRHGLLAAAAARRPSRRRRHRLQPAHRRLDEGRRRRVRQLVRELAADPQAAAEQERGGYRGEGLFWISSMKTHSYINRTLAIYFYLSFGEEWTFSIVNLRAKLDLHLKPAKIAPIMLMPILYTNSRNGYRSHGRLCKPTLTSCCFSWHGTWRNHIENLIPSVQYILSIRNEHNGKRETHTSMRIRKIVQ